MKHKAMDFVKSGIALALTEGSRASAEMIADARWGAEVARLVKSSVPAGSTDAENWAGPIAEADRAGAAFFEAVAERSIIGRMRSLRRVPPDIACLTPTTSFSAEWRGEGKARPVDAAIFDASAIKLLDLGVLVVVTKELLETGNRIAESVVSGMLVDAVAEALDRTFLDPTNEGEEDIRPASITHDVDAVPVDDDLREAVGELLEDFGGDVETSYFILNPATAARLSGADHPGLGIRGGEFLGAPALASRHAPLGKLILADGAGIALAEGRGGISTSSHATVEMSAEPGGDSGEPTAAEVVSLWQTGARGLLASREINWRVVRPGAVAILDLEGEAD